MPNLVSSFLTTAGSSSADIFKAGQDVDDKSQGHETEQQHAARLQHPGATGGQAALLTPHASSWVGNQLPVLARDPNTCNVPLSASTCECVSWLLYRLSQLASISITQAKEKAQGMVLPYSTL